MQHGFSYCGHWQLQCPLGSGLFDENKGGCGCWEGNNSSAKWTRYGSWITVINYCQHVATCKWVETLTPRPMDCKRNERFIISGTSTIGNMTCPQQSRWWHGILIRYEWVWKWTEDDQNNILHEMTLLMENMMDQGLDDLIREEAPTQMVNLIL